MSLMTTPRKRRRPPPKRPMIRQTHFRTFTAIVLLGVLSSCAYAVNLNQFVTRFGGPYWYNVSLRGQRSGYLKVTAAVEDTPDGPRLRVQEYVKLVFRIDTRTLQIESTQTASYDESLCPTRVDFFQNQIGRISEATVEVGEDELTVTTTDPTGTRTKTVPRPDTLGSEMMIFHAGMNDQIDQNWSFTFSTFDPFVNHLDTFHATYAGTEQGPDGLLTHVEIVTEQLNLTSHVWLNPDGTMYRQQIPALMGAQFVRTNREDALAEISGAAFHSVIAAGRPPVDPHNADTIRLEATSAADDAAGIIPDTSLQDVQDTPEGALITIFSQQTPKTTVNIPVTGEQFAPYLQANEIAQADAERIQSIAREVVGEETDAWACAKKLLDWVDANLRQVRSEPRPISALEILDQGEGDCTEHAILFSALAQSVGIPTKIILGLVHTDAGYAYHAWNEVYVGEWVQMDPSWGLYTRGAGHLQLAGGAVSREAMIKENIATGKTIGTLFLQFADDSTQQP